MRKDSTCFFINFYQPRKHSLSNFLCQLTYKSVHLTLSNTNIHTYTHPHIYTYTHIYIHTYTYTRTHTYTHIRTYVHTYIHTYIHIYELAKLILQASSIRIVYKRSVNLKELSAPSNPYKNTQGEEKGCFKCSAQRCDYCKEFLNACTSFRSTAAGRTFTIQKLMSSKSKNVVYLAECVACKLQGVG